MACVGDSSVENPNDSHFLSDLPDENTVISHPQQVEFSEDRGNIATPGLGVSSHGGHNPELNFT
jgi:hypothetical protein